MRCPRPARAAGMWLALMLAAGGAAAEPVRDAAYLRELKSLQHQMLLAGGARALARAESQGVPLRRGARPRQRTGSVARPPRELREAGVRRPVPARLQAPQEDLGAVPANRRANDAARDVTPGSTQSEVAIASSGMEWVAAWNDGEQEEGQGLGWAASSDAGARWIDGGPAPYGSPVRLWISDPVLAVDERAGTFYLGGMVTTDAGRNGIAIARGRFVGGAFRWEIPIVVRSTRDTVPDKPWIAADSVTGTVHVVYTTFFRVNGKITDQIEYQRSTDGGITWSLPVCLSDPEERGLVQGARPAVGPGGEVHVTWKTIDTTLTAAGTDRIRARTSRDAGASFAPGVTVAGVFSNFSSGAPGFNRGTGLGFPSIAVDRGTGITRGRIHMAWEEPLNFYDDPTGQGAEVAEAEPNDLAVDATEFEIGSTLRSAIDHPADVDWFRFAGTRGQTAVIRIDSVSGPLDVALRLLCGDGMTRLAYSAPLAVRRRVIVFTLPTTGDFYVSVSPHDDSTGSYRLSTGVASPGSERGRDHRDAFSSWSDDGAAWSPAVRLHDDPPWFDNWLPEIAVGEGGRPYAAWYDWRTADPASCGAESHVYLARSDDGGGSWNSLGPVTTGRTHWTQVGSNLAPNQGDYIALTATGTFVVAAWADGREGDPNVYVSAWPYAAVAREILIEAPEVSADQVRLLWRTPAGVALAGVVERRTSWSDWAALRTVRSGSTSTIVVTDRDVAPGVRYDYRIQLTTAEGPTPTEPVTVVFPDAEVADLAIDRVLPNPASGPVRVWLRRLDDSPARLELLDLQGRRQWIRMLDAGWGRRGQEVLDVTGLVPGLYFVRLTQAGRTDEAKVMVMR